MATTGTYTDRNGQEKRRYLTVGKLFQRDDGSMSMKIDAIPVNFDGWLNAYDLDEKRKEDYQQNMPDLKAAAAGETQDDSFDSEQILF